MCIRTCARRTKKALQKQERRKKGLWKKELRKTVLWKKVIVTAGEETATASTDRCGRSRGRLVSRQHHRPTPTVTDAREGGEGKTTEDYRHVEKG